jgi:hypothetical protein
MTFQDALIIDTKEAATEYKRIAGGATTGFDWKKMSRHLNPDSWDTQVALAPIDPVEFFETDLATKRPADYVFPDALQKSLDAGGIKKYTALYADHAKTNPYAAAIALTTTKTTVFGGR